MCLLRSARGRDPTWRVSGQVKHLDAARETDVNSCFDFLQQFKVSVVGTRERCHMKREFAAGAGTEVRDPTARGEGERAAIA